MPTTIKQIKSQLDDKLGTQLTVVANLGRKKINRQSGRLAETFPAVFVVELTNTDDTAAVKRVSYSYTDVLTHDILLDFEQAQ